MKKTQPITSQYFALLSAIALDDKAAVQLLPAGDFKARDGRPGPGKYWRVSDAQGVKLAAEMTRTAQLSAFNFDYEHQTLHALKNGQPAPASGWATQFEWRAGKGLYALNVDWTAKAQGHIDAKEYLYISPLINFDEQGNVTGVLNAALVNTPAVLGMDALVASLQADLSAALSTQTKPEPNVNLLQLLIAALSLKADATEADAMAALSALQARAVEKPVIPQQLAAALSIKTDADVDVAVSAVAALQAQSKTSEQTTLDTIKALQQQVAALSAQSTAATVTSVIDKAIADGKLIPAMQGWATDLGNKDLAALQAYVKDAPVMSLGTQQSRGKDPGEGGDTAALSAVQADVIARMGLTAEQFNKAA
jgi:phage I-like protein